ncbi:MAG: aminotransferase class IV family protein [Actinobacteria bacterium]|nr:aminotransferase class IV family protein [Actinomycetota bacterium]
MENLPAVANGVLTTADDVRIDVRDEGFLRGDGVFEVIRLYAGRPFAFAEHLARMRRSAERLRLPFSPEVVEQDVDLVLSAAGPIDGALRLVATRGGFRLAVVEHIQELPPTLSLATVLCRPTLLMDGVKSLSYAGNMLARRLAAEQGADDALLVRPDGVVLEAPTSSFFYVRHGELFTPPLSEGILASITREHLLAITDATERSIASRDLPLIEEAFLASTLREVHPVHRLDDNLLPGERGKLTANVARAMGTHVKGSVEPSVGQGPGGRKR